MKQFIGILMLLICAVSLNAQTFEKFDTTSKSKNQISTITKMFIAENFKSVKNVVEDNDGSLILVNADSKLAGCNYSYSVKFLIRDNQYKAVIYDVKSKENNLSRTSSYYSPELGEKYPGFLKTNFTKSNWIRVQNEVPAELNKMLASYNTYVKNSTIYNW